MKKSKRAALPAPFVLAPQRADGEPYTTSEIISEGAGVQRRTIDRLILAHKTDFEEFGRVSFEMRPFQTRGGMQDVKVYHLNEEQATLLLTYLKNTERVRAFKKELVRQFFAMRAELMKRRTYRVELKPIRRELTDVIQEVDDGRWSYKKYTDLAYKAALGKNAAQLRKERGAEKKAAAIDYMTSDEIAAVTKRQNQIAVLLELGMDYQAVKAAMQGNISVLVPTAVQNAV